MPTATSNARPRARGWIAVVRARAGDNGARHASSAAAAGESVETNGTNDVDANVGGGNGAATRGDAATTRETTRARESADRGGWDDGDDNDGRGRGGFGGGGGGGGEDGDARDDDASARFSWTLAMTRDVGSACDGGALFAVVIAVVLSPAAWLVFSAIKPSSFEKERFAMELREAEEVAKRHAARAAEMEKLEKRAARSRWSKTSDSTPRAEEAVASPAVTESPRARETGEESREPRDATPVAEVSPASEGADTASVRVVSVSERTVESTSASTAAAATTTAMTAEEVSEAPETEPSSEEDVERDDEKYRKTFSVFDKDGSGSISIEELTEVMKTSGADLTNDEISEMMKEADSDGNGEVDFEEFVKMMKAKDAAELNEREKQLLEKHHHADEEYLPTHPEHPRYKLIQAVREANSLVHSTHERKLESDSEFKDALRYRKQVVHIASEHGIIVAPIAEIKETFEQAKRQSASAAAAERVSETMKSAFSATKRFVDFATPHVRSASVKAIEVSKSTATKASEKVKSAHAKGELRVPSLEEAGGAAKSASRRVLAEAIRLFDHVTGHEHDDTSNDSKRTAGGASA